MPGSSGRVHKNTEGEWVWSDDEMDTSNDTTAEPVSQSVSPAFKNFFTCQTVAKMSLLLFSILQVAVYALPLPWCSRFLFMLAGILRDALIIYSLQNTIKPTQISESFECLHVR